jgi:tRNA(Ile)-lysidine synthase
VFEKFGGGTKPLRSYLIDKKIPTRLRDSLPVLASGNQILCILGVEISESVKIDKNTKMAYAVSIKKSK